MKAIFYRHAEDRGNVEIIYGLFFQYIAACSYYCYLLGVWTLRGKLIPAFLHDRHHARHVRAAQSSGARELEGCGKLAASLQHL